MTTAIMPAAAPGIGLKPSQFAPVIVATDGRAQSDGALAVGRILAESSDALRLVSVLPPTAMIPETHLVVAGDLAPSRRSELQEAVNVQMLRVWGTTEPLQVETGDPASTIVRLAHASHASLIVSGIGRHQVSDRIFGDETALLLIRTADVPIFAATADLLHAPRAIVVASDFSGTSSRAAQI